MYTFQYHNLLGADIVLPLEGGYWMALIGLLNKSTAVEKIRAKVKHIFLLISV